MLVYRVYWFCIFARVRQIFRIIKEILYLEYTCVFNKVLIDIKKNPQSNFSSGKFLKQECTNTDRWGGGGGGILQIHVFFLSLFFTGKQKQK